MALILILEDGPFIALDIESVLDKAGYRQHVTLATCAEAVDWLNENNPQMAIVNPRLSDGWPRSLSVCLSSARRRSSPIPENRTAWRKIEPSVAAGNFS